MRYLIDTNVFIYMTENKQFLSDDVIYLLEDYSNQFYVSSESVKELIHLFQTGKFKNSRWKTSEDMIHSLENEWNIIIKYIGKEHLLTLASLNRVDNHNDPNDRLIIAQAITEHLPLISSDRKFEHYRKHQLQFIYNRK
jgi:PIN domain nuclease of toxin-antitoxin system